MSDLDLKNRNLSVALVLMLMYRLYTALQCDQFMHFLLIGLLFQLFKYFSSTKGLFATLSQHKTLHYYAECRYAGCLVSITVMPNAIMLNAVMLSV